MANWMVIEDEIDIHDVILGMFELWGISGTSFTSGMDAIQCISTVDHEGNTAQLPQLALIDIRLPDTSGISVASQLRSSKRLGGMSIVLMTAYHLSPQEEAAAIEQTQASAVIYKPLPEMQHLRKLLESALR